MTRLVFFLACLVVFGFPQGATAQGGSLSIIRDAETETALKNWAEPLIRAASLNPQSVSLIIVHSDQVNAFVAGGQNIFLYTGLLMKTSSVGEVIGVMAHELGHIQGGHLSRVQQALKRASYETLLGTALGIGAAILTGDGAVAGAAVSGANTLAARNFLQFSRVQESSADQAAIRYLQASRLDPSGLKSFMQKLEDQELIPVSQQVEYVRTHPLTRSRIDSIAAGIDQSPFIGQSFPASWSDQYDRMRAKMVGYLTPQQIEWHFKPGDTGIPADYARAVAAYRLNQTTDALRRIDVLIAREPKNPYFHEMKGQMLTDFGRVREAVAPLAEAVRLKPTNGLIAIAYAQALLEGANDPARAVTVLESARRDEPRSSKRLRLLATAKGRLGQTAAAAVDLAEEAFLQRRFELARQKAEQALPQLKKGSSDALRANDILEDVKTALSAKEDR